MATDGDAPQDANHAIDAVAQANLLQSKLADEVHLRRFTEKVLDCRQKEIETQERENTKLRKQLASLQKELADSKKQLQETKSHIFDLQPHRKDITESEAQDSYKRLCASVRRWVENRLSSALDDLDSGRLRALSISPSQASRIVSLLREQSKRCVSIEQSDEYHVIAIIMNYLWHVFFTKSFYCPLDDSGGDNALKWMEDLQSAMSRLPRDVSHCREWRSETLTALTSQPAFRTRRDSHIALISEDLASVLSPIALKTSPAELRASVRRSIIEPAADLAHRLHLAPNIFSLKWPARSAWSRLEVYECTNLATAGTNLDLAGTSSSTPARRHVSYLFDIAPGLFVERVEGGKKSPAKAICKPNVLVYAGDREIPHGLTLMRWLWDNSTSTRGFGREPVSNDTSKNIPALRKKK